MTPQEQQALQHAARLICAVHDNDKTDIQQLLTQLTTQHLYALAVTLAAHVTPNQTINIPETPTTICRRHTRAAAELFDCEPSDIHSDKRTAHIAKARMVAMAAASRDGLTTTEVGRQFNRDHSTVVHAKQRVRNDPILRSLVDTITRQQDGEGAA